MKLSLSAVAAALLFAAPALAQPDIVLFDGPGATGTFPTAISDTNRIVGSYRNDDAVLTGFLRGRKGAIDSFHPHDADATHPLAVNDAGAVAGYFLRQGRTRAFFKSAQGGIGVIKIDGAHVLQAVDIDNAGDIAGTAKDGGRARGFLIVNPSAPVLFDAPGATDTFPVSMNDSAAVTGRYVDDLSPDVDQGFIRAPDGSITTFRVPSSASTDPASIDDAGVVVGSYADVDGVVHGFKRAANGAITSYSVPDAASTTLAGIDDGGTVYGTWMDDTGNSHGFTQRSDGTIVTFDAPGASSTQVTAVNSHGVSTGLAFVSGVTHGFRRSR